MKEKIMNGVVVVLLAVLANFPMYRSMKATSDELSSAFTIITSEIYSWKSDLLAWQSDIDKLQGRVNKINNDLHSKIDKGLAMSDSLLYIVSDSTIASIYRINSDLKYLNRQIEKFATDKLDKGINEVIKRQNIPGLPGF